MFTGIATDVGRVRAVEARGDTRFELETAFDLDGVAMGASICCAGVCLTVVAKGPGWFAVDVSGETLSRSTLGTWRQGTRVNLERSLRMGDELGGHVVAGHVDAVGHVAERRNEGDSVRFGFATPASLAPYIAEKGSITVDGVSLTVNSVADTDEGCIFGVNIIPHTQQVTTLGGLAAGDAVNLEIDTLARYVARMAASRHRPA
ncbi:MAG: riboflavin synthase [Proteobacteria bacterium]|nr:riboflavin synthase [Pseudomonadota bacterium]